MELFWSDLGVLFVYFRRKIILAWGFVVLQSIYCLEYFQSCWCGQLNIIRFFWTLFVFPCSLTIDRVLVAIQSCCSTFVQSRISSVVSLIIVLKVSHHCSGSWLSSSFKFRALKLFLSSMIRVSWNFVFCSSSLSIQAFGLFCLWDARRNSIFARTNMWSNPDWEPMSVLL